MPVTIRNSVSYLISFLIGAGLLYLVLRNVALDRMLDILSSANYLLLIPVIASMLLSHVVRAWRWNLLLKTLPESEAKSLDPSLKTSFYSIMIGYMLNAVTPRLGEVARAGNTAFREKLSFSGVLGTVAADRFVLDPIVLLLGFGSILFLDDSILTRTYSEFIEPVAGFMAPYSVYIAVFGGVCVVLLLGYLHRLRRNANNVDQTSGNHHGWQRLIDWIRTFRDGVLTIADTGRPIALLISTVGIWFGYLAVVFFSFHLFEGSETYIWTWSDSWILLMVGSLGIIIPSPGGLGTYHYVITQSLVLFWAIDYDFAATFALFTHAAQVIVYTGTGFVCILLQGASLRDLLDRSRTAASAAQPDS